MLVQYYYPLSLSPARLDKYLANGWFRSAPMLYRSELICLDGDVFSTVNIRVKLSDYTFKKSLAKILRKNKDRFYTEVRRVCITPEKEIL